MVDDVFAGIQHVYTAKTESDVFAKGKDGI